MDSKEDLRIDPLTLLFVIWFILWVLALLILPRDYQNTVFFILGAAPVIGWFMIKPKKRIIWLTRALLGINGLDRQ